MPSPKSTLLPNTSNPGSLVAVPAAPSDAEEALATRAEQDRRRRHADTQARYRERASPGI
ncbi:hypothetical protein B0H12DRAFT_1246829 [Mycena haematopus]|nr:hypothetical protein B0H12DRAFT_1246829 [Mycena haematopus]